MHILHVIDTLRPGGAQRMLVELANQTREAGDTVSVCVTRSGSDLASQLSPDIALCVLDRRRRFDRSAMLRLARWVAGQDVDVIHSHGRSTFSLLAFLKTTGLIRKPIVMHDHTGDMSQGGSPLRFRTWASKHVAHYVGVFPPMEEWARRAGIPRERRSRIDYALDLRSGVLDPRAGPPVSNVDLRREFGVASGALGVCLGGVRPQKGIDVLLAAAARSRRRGEFKIVVVGGVCDQRYWNACLRDVQRLHLQDTVLFAGERADIGRWLGQFDFAIHAARFESGPLVVIEHLFAGLPLICTRTGGVAQRAEELGVERFVPPADPQALSQAIDQLLAASSSERERRANHGRQIALRHFDLRSVMPAWRQVYETATRTHRAGCDPLSGIARPGSRLPAPTKHSSSLWRG